MDKEYRVVGKYGQWGDIHWNLEFAMNDLEYCNQEYEGRDEFHIEERHVTRWSQMANEPVADLDLDNF